MNRRTLLRAAAGAVLLPALPFAAAARAADDALPPVVDTLPDGATVVTLPEPDAPGVVWEAFFRVGMGDEGGNRGIRSLLSRCWIGETPWSTTFGTAAALSHAGASAGTACGPDWVEVWGACGPDPVDVASAARTLFTDIVANAAFGQASVEAARAEQQRVLALRSDDVLYSVLDAAQSRAFGSSPYAQTPLADADSVAAIPWAQVGAYYKRFFRPDRAVFVAAGRITPDAAKRYLIATLGAGDWDSGPSAPPEKPIPAALPPPAGMHPLRLPRRAPASCVAAAFLAPGLRGGSGRSDYTALLVLDAVLRGGKSSRLFALRDHPPTGGAPLGYEIRTDVTPGRDQSLLTVWCAGDRPATEVRERLLAALRALGTGAQPPTDAEVVRAKTYVAARRREAHQQLRDRAFGVGWAEAMGLGAAWDTDFSLRLEGVGTENVAGIARRVLGNEPAVAFVDCP